MNDNTHLWLWFILAFYPGNEKIWQLVSYYKNVKKAYNEIYNGNCPLLTELEQKAVKSTHIEQCDSIIKYCRKNNYTILTYDDENYPYMLKDISNPPAVLFCMGDTNILNNFPAVSCVGTRRHSGYSTIVTKKICSDLAKNGFTIVSGFSAGIDSAAHIGAIEAGGKTVAVLACGLDYDYPEVNAKYKGIIARRGLIMTEYLPKAHPDRYSFYKRNRIIAGLTFGTVIFEAGENSGSLSTAEHALKQGRKIFCIPPADIFDKRYSGVVKYLRNGAVPVFNYLDIVDKYYNNCLKVDNSDAPSIDTDQAPGIDTDPVPSIDTDQASGIDTDPAPSTDTDQASGIDADPAPSTDTDQASGTDAASAYIIAPAESKGLEYMTDTQKKIELKNKSISVSLKLKAYKKMNKTKNYNKTKKADNTDKSSLSEMNIEEALKKSFYNYDDMTEKQRMVVDCIMEKELLPDDIMDALGMDAMEVLAILTELEIMGAVTVKNGGRYALSVRL